MVCGEILQKYKTKLIIHDQDLRMDSKRYVEDIIRSNFIHDMIVVYKNKWLYRKDNA